MSPHTKMGKGRSQREKRDYVGKIPVGPPPPTPPVWERPVIKKKLGLLFILGPKEHFWSSPTNQSNSLH